MQGGGDDLPVWDDSFDLCESMWDYDGLFNPVPLENLVPFDHFAVTFPVLSVLLVWGSKPLNNVTRSPLLVRKRGDFSTTCAGSPCRIVVFDGATDDLSELQLGIFGGNPTLVYNIAHVLDKLPNGVQLDVRQLPALFCKRRSTHALAARGEVACSKIVVLNTPYRVTRELTEDTMLLFVDTGGDVSGMHDLLSGSPRFRPEHVAEVIGEFVATTTSTICSRCMLVDGDRVSVQCYEFADQGMRAENRGHWCCTTCYGAMCAVPPTERACPSPDHSGGALVYIPPPRGDV